MINMKTPAPQQKEPVGIIKMGKTIAVSGKGGTGKTTVSALIIRWLSEHRSKSILAVDADSNVCLHEVLGVNLKETVGSIREEMKALAAELPGGMSKQQYLEYKILSSLTECPDFDLLAMGRPEGPGCYCYANNLLRDILDTLSRRYDFVVIDNQAGMEHLSRRTAGRMDTLLMISDPTVRGIRTAGKISRLVKELDTRIENKYLLLNRVTHPLPQIIRAAVDAEGIELLGCIPEDEILLRSDREGQTLWERVMNSSAYKAVGQLIEKLLM
ncbi:MAG: AAA family ATPase [Candidatus Aminicenantales bacterium]